MSVTLEQMSLLAAVLAAGCVASAWLLRRGGAAMAGTRRAQADRAYAAYQQTSRFGGLDALRALSVIAVIWAHTMPQQAVRLLDQGHRGVDFFFAISGFLVTTLLLREHRRAGAISLRQFYMRRTLRIFPLYYAVLALYCVLVLLLMRGSPKADAFWTHLPAYLTYTSNWFVRITEAPEGVIFYFAWSLATEEQFYLFWPLLLVAALRWLPRTVGVACVATVLLLVQFAGAQFGDTALGWRMAESLAPAILFGVLFAALMDDPDSFRALHLLLGHRAAAPLVAAVLVLLLGVESPWRAGSLCMAVLVATVCMREDTWLHPLLRFKPAVFVGTISYGVYLLHMLAANAVKWALGAGAGPAVFVLTVPVVIAMAAVSYFFFERPILNYKRRYASLPMAPAAQQAAGAGAHERAIVGETHARAVAGEAHVRASAPVTLEATSRQLL